MPECTLPETGLKGCRPVSATAGRLAARAAGRAFYEHMVPLIPAPGHTGRPAGKYPGPQMQKAGTGRPLKTHVKADRQPGPATECPGSTQADRPPCPCLGLLPGAVLTHTTVVAYRHLEGPVRFSGCCRGLCLSQALQPALAGKPRMCHGTTGPEQPGQPQMYFERSRPGLPDNTHHVPATVSPASACLRSVRALT